MRRALLITALAVWARAQDPAALEYTGQPLRLPFHCTEEDIRTFGLTCPPQQPCPVYLELADVEPVGNRVFVVGNLHTEAVTLASVLLAGSDGGRTWQEPHERLRSAGLDQIQFLDFEAGWVAGQYLHAIPRDPFLLLTTDGGKNWRLRPVSSEGRVGAIDSFHFDSRAHGVLLLDRRMAGEATARFEMWESQTGGESWMIREVSDRPIPAPHKTARTPETGWRVRADATSYRIEKRMGERWETVAAFLTRVGECRAPEVVVAPEPPVPSTPPEPPEPDAPPAPRKPPTLKRPF